MRVLANEGQRDLPSCREDTTNRAVKGSAGQTQWLSWGSDIRLPSPKSADEVDAIAKKSALQLNLRTIHEHLHFNRHFRRSIDVNCW